MRSFKEFVTEDGAHISEQFGTTDEFIRRHFKVQYLEDTIYAEAVQYVNACGDAKAWVKIDGDTLILTTKEPKEELCASANWVKYQYWIQNTENKKYLIKQDE